jgi:hypothetical protein
MSTPDAAGLDELKRQLRRLDAERAILEARLCELDRQADAPAVLQGPMALDTPISPANIDQHSSPGEKIALFRRLFRGREDVFPIRRENRSSGRSGYAPACANERKPGITRSLLCSVALSASARMPALRRPRGHLPTS